MLDCGTHMRYIAVVFRFTHPPDTNFSSFNITYNCRLGLRKLSLWRIKQAWYQIKKCVMCLWATTRANVLRNKKMKWIIGQNKWCLMEWMSIFHSVSDIWTVSERIRPLFGVDIESVELAIQQRWSCIFGRSNAWIYIWCKYLCNNAVEISTATGGLWEFDNDWCC